MSTQFVVKQLLWYPVLDSCLMRHNFLSSILASWEHIDILWTDFCPKSVAISDLHVQRGVVVRRESLSFRHRVNLTKADIYIVLLH